MGKGDAAAPFPYFTNTCFLVRILSCIHRGNQVKGAFCFNGKCPSQACVFYLQLVALFGDAMVPLRRCNLTGGSMSLGVGLKVAQSCSISCSLSASCMQMDLGSLSFLLQHLASTQISSIFYYIYIIIYIIIFTVTEKSLVQSNRSFLCYYFQLLWIHSYLKKKNLKTTATTKLK